MLTLTTLTLREELQIPGGSFVLLALRPRSTVTPTLFCANCSTQSLTISLKISVLLESHRYFITFLDFY